jgi:UDP-N-acetylglucosamine--N-acetylmuramyl-(pentapeptide) pyrophosphoryl-undecaprenol N-acetylglucosamine transferase
MTKILFAGGGTYGHVYPIIAIVREIKRLTNEEVNFFYIGPKDKIAQIFLSKEGVKVKAIMAGKFRRYFGPSAIIQNFFDIFLKFPIGFFQAFFYISFLSPDLIFSKGGYGSLPSSLSGFLLGTPVFLHESDIIPGLANRISAKFSSKIFVSFPAEENKFPSKKVISVGNPIRRELLGGSKETAKKIFNLTYEKPIILVFGGSQGARRLNNLIIQILPEILAEFELIHQSGPQNFKEVKNSADEQFIKNEGLKKYYHLFPFLEEEELKQAYAASDLIVSRAGSGSIFEISAQGKPSILIPLPESAQEHQAMNAAAYEKNGACLVIEEANLTSPRFFLEKLKNLLIQPGELEKMKKAAMEFSRPRAAEAIAEYILSLTQ